jgi:hypothetical protein
MWCHVPVEHCSATLLWKRQDMYVHVLRLNVASKIQNWIVWSCVPWLIVIAVQDRGFSQWYSRGLCLSGIWQYITGWSVPDISGQHRDLFFKGWMSSEFSVFIGHSTLDDEIVIFSKQWTPITQWGLGSTQRQAWELILGPCLGTKARFLSFNRTQSRVVTALLTGHNALRKHFYLVGLLDSPLCRRCGAEDETSAHFLCECEALPSLRRVSGLLFLGARGC